MRCMPDLFPFKHIDDVVVVAPEVCVLCIQRALIRGDECFATGELPEEAGVGYYLGVQVKQNKYLRSKNNISSMPATHEKT